MKASASKKVFALILCRVMCKPVNERLFAVLHEVDNVPHLMVDHHQVGVGDAGAHLDPVVTSIIEVLS